MEYKADFFFTAGSNEFCCWTRDLTTTTTISRKKLSEQTFLQYYNSIIDYNFFVEYLT